MWQRMPRMGGSSGGDELPEELQRPEGRLKWICGSETRTAYPQRTTS